MPNQRVINLIGPLVMCSVLSPASAATQNPITPTFSYCQPKEVANTATQLIPVTLRVKFEQPPPVAIKNNTYDWDDSTGIESICGGLDGHTVGAVFDFVVVNSSGQQSLLFSSYKIKSNPKHMIERLHLPSDNCGSGAGALPCELVLIEAYHHDTNNDTNLSSNDARHLFVVDAYGQQLRNIIPDDVTFMSFQWNPAQRSMTFRARKDTNNDGVFSAEDGEILLESKAPDWPLASPLITQEIRDIHQWYQAPATQTK